MLSVIEISFLDFFERLKKENRGGEIVCKKCKESKYYGSTVIQKMRFCICLKCRPLPKPPKPIKPSKPPKIKQVKELSERTIANRQKRNDAIRNIHPLEILKKYNLKNEQLRNVLKNKENPTIHDSLFIKLVGFFRDEEITIDTEDLIKKIGPDPKCYLTGRKIDLYDVSSYSLDHKIPRSKGGTSTLDNCEICLREVNTMKNNLPYEVFIVLCKEICSYNI